MHFVQIEICICANRDLHLVPCVQGLSAKVKDLHVGLILLSGMAKEYVTRAFVHLQINKMCANLSMCTHGDLFPMFTEADDLYRRAGPTADVASKGSTFY